MPAFSPSPGTTIGIPMLIRCHEEKQESREIVRLAPAANNQLLALAHNAFVHARRSGGEKLHQVLLSSEGVHLLHSQNKMPVVSHAGEAKDVLENEAESREILRSLYLF